METIKRYLGLDNEGRGVGPVTSLFASLVLSIIVSIAVRLIFPTTNTFLRFIVFFGVMAFVFLWIDANHRKNRRNRR
ncbi:hypothetical protein [Timonella sp. A28]|uniref:hypothetical protein n=1 Tax=Timonella sp. A28 TaxID=3442640 RepID=UPI003EB6EC57